MRHAILGLVFTLGAGRPLSATDPRPAELAQQYDEPEAEGRPA